MILINLSLEQVSRRNLRVAVIDSLVLHGPVKGDLGLTLEAYRSMEEAVDQGKVRFLGLSNHYDLDFLKAIFGII